MSKTTIPKKPPKNIQLQKSGSQNAYTGLAQLTKQPPEFCRLPKAGQRCPLTGLSRSALNDLILPSAENPNPPVRSVLLKKRGALRGIRLIDYDSLIRFINLHDENGERIAGDAV